MSNSYLQTVAILAGFFALSQKVWPPVDFKFKGDEGEQVVARPFSRQDLHRLALRLNSLLSLSMILVVLREIHSSSGKLKKVRQASRPFSRHATADGRSFSHFILNSMKSFTGLVFRRSVENGAHVVGHSLFVFSWHFGQDISGLSGESIPIMHPKNWTAH